MRNWNSVGLPGNWNWQVSFQTTYEELKRIIQGIHPAWVIASRLPMRNWNFCLPQSLLPVILASRLPMRNWNSQSSVLFKLLSRFQTTYEELKHDRFRFLLTRGLGFQTTYEELKLAFEIASSVRSWCFQTTYEELKLPGIESWQAVTTSFQTTYEELKPILRDKDPSQLELLPDYLWGIETTIEAYGRCSDLELPDYLWGIETFDFIFQWEQATRFQTTYEELKRLWQEPVYFAHLASRLPMRNWNVSNLRT